MRLILIFFALFIAAPAQAEFSLFGAPPLTKAVMSGDMNGVKAALLNEGNPNATTDAGRTLLMETAIAEQLDIMALLIDRKADVNRTDDLGNTALAYAAVGREPLAIETLIKAGAKPDTPNKQGLTPLMAAAKAGRHENVHALLKAGARAKLSDYSGRTAQDWAEDSRDQTTMAMLAEAD